ncbi:MAG: type II toxin-antitoxin system PemK/MazF family toxin [Chloroflexota bacterium]
MDENTETSVSIPQTLFDQAEILAKRLNISQRDLFATALEHFISEQNQMPVDELNKSDPNTGTKRAVINQGDIYWLLSEDRSGSEAGIRHPHVVIQDNVLNHSRIHTLVMCALTSNLKRANLPGNVLLEMGEGNLSKPSVVEASKVSSVDKTALGEYIGSLSEGRVNQILAGMRFLETSFFGQ